MRVEDDGQIEGATLDDAFVVLSRLPSRSEASRTYQGRHLRLGYPVYVRFEDGAGPGELEAEVECLSQVHHPAIPQLLTSGAIERVGKLSYLVREFAPGVPLDTLLRAEYRLEPLRAVRVAMQLLDALAALHQQGFLHGDLKPGNVIVDPADGDRVHLIDLGASRSVRSSDPPRRGTPRYLAPEVVAGQLPTPASEVFGAGWILRECLLGQLGSRGEVEPASVLALQDRAAREELARRVPLPPSVRVIIEQATAADPEHRFETVDEFLDSLARLDEGELASWYLGSFPPSSGVEEQTADLTNGLSLHARMPSYLRELPELTSVGRPSVWIFSGGPAAIQSTLGRVTESLARKVDVRFLDEDARFAIHLEMQQGRTRGPWLVIFSDFHALLEDALLGDLCQSGETLRMLISSHANLELAQTTINNNGLDFQVCLPAEAGEIETAINVLLERAARRRRYFDGLRVALFDALERGEETSQPSDAALR